MVIWPPGLEKIHKTRIKKMKRLQFLLASVATLFLTATSAVAAEVAMDGYCPVCYMEAGKAERGSQEFAAEHRGKVYYFVSEDTKKLFEENPDKYLPAYDGYCAYGMSFGKKVKSDPRAFTVVNGKTYFNKNEAIAKDFRKDEAGYIAKADANWKKLSMMEKEGTKKDEMMKK